MKLKIDGKLMYGDYSESQIALINKEMEKPREKRLYLMGIEFSRVNKIEVII